MKSYVKNFKSNSNITKVSYRRISNGIDNNMNIAIIGSPKYDSVRAVRDFLFNIKQKLGTDVNIITRGNKDGCEKWVRKYALEFGFRYTEYNSAHTSRNLYSGMTNDYYDKPYHPTQRLHQYDCIVKHSDKIIYFGGIKPTEQKYFEKLLGRFNKKVNYIN
tara:strand:+ start:601 stop:1083 length:483 start_codon:yes stop_codon:yes gene_type:complete